MYEDTLLLSSPLLSSPLLSSPLSNTLIPTFSFKELALLSPTSPTYFLCLEKSYEMDKHLCLRASFDGAISKSTILSICVCVCVCVPHDRQLHMILSFMCVCLQDIIVSFTTVLFLSAISDISAYTPLYICLEGVCVSVCVCVCVYIGDLGWVAD